MVSFIQKKETFFKIYWSLILFINILITFTILYVLLDLTHLGYLQDHFEQNTRGNGSLKTIEQSFYFSAITLMSVGYGDVTPFGLARVLAMIEALIGYLIPFVIVFQFIPSHNFSKK